MSDSKSAPTRLEGGIAAVLVLTGAVLAVGAWQLPRSNDPNVPGPGAAPGALGVLLVCCGLLLLWQAWRSRSVPQPVADADEGSQRQALLAVALVAGSILALEPLGFLLTSMVFLSAAFIGLGQARWTAALPAAALASSALWLFFTKLLGVGLPYGLIAEILFR